MIASTATARDPTYFVCHYGHEHDRVYTENLVRYFIESALSYKIVELGRSGAQAALQECLDADRAVVIGYNSQIDHSWLGAQSFVSLAAERGDVVIQWILDHPSSRWPEFQVSNKDNSAFLLNSHYAERFFEKYCLPGAITGVMGGIGSSQRSRANLGDVDRFARRVINCVIALGFRRIGRSIEETLALICGLDANVARAVNEAVSAGRFDLDGPLEVHLLTALERNDIALDAVSFNACFRLVEESVQAFRRLSVFQAARDFPVLIQSDDSAADYVRGGTAEFAADVSMVDTLTRMRKARSVLSISPLNDMVHDRTMNALSAGCVAIVEDNRAHRGVFQHGVNALVYRYGDDSLAECFDIVCTQSRRAYAIAEAGYLMRDDPRFRFDSADSLVEVARRHARNMISKDSLSKLVSGR